MAEGKKKGLFYGYVIMVACIVMLVVGTGIIVNTVNQFVLPITESTGMSRAAFTLYTSFQNIALMLTVPFLSKIYSKIKPKIMTIIGFLVMCAAYFMLSQCSQAWQFYVCGVFIGFGLAFVSTTTVGILINNWFIKNKGTVMGIAMAGSGFGSMNLQPACPAAYQQHELPDRLHGAGRHHVRLLHSRVDRLCVQARGQGPASVGLGREASRAGQEGRRGRRYHRGQEC